METTLQMNLYDSRIASRTARIAVSLFFFVCVPLSVWENNVQSKIFVLHDQAATANNLLTNEFAFRATIVSHIIGTVIFTLMVLLFYRLFSPIDKHLSRMMIIPILAQMAIVFVLEALNFSALMTLKGEVGATIDSPQQQEVAYFLLRIYRLSFGANKIIFGLYLIPMGMLVFRSGFAPRIIGMLIMIGGVMYIIDTCLYILLQRADYLIVRYFKLYASLCYSLAFLWFMIKGVQNKNELPMTSAL